LPRAPDPPSETRIEFLLALVVIERLEHDVGDLIGAMRPDIDDLVVALARRDDAFAILFFNIIDLFLGRLDFLAFSFGIIISSIPMERRPESLRGSPLP